jgi:hypothetical protein
MRFNAKHTCIDFLDHGINVPLAINNSEWNEARIVKFEHEVVSSFPKELFKSGPVRYITMPFYQAYAKHRAKLHEVLQKESLGEASGTLVFNVDKETKTVFYAMNHNHETDDYNYIYMEFVKSAVDNYQTTHLSCAVQQISKADRVIFHIGDRYREHYGSEAPHHIISQLVYLVGFLKFCEIETKVLKPKEKLREKGVRYFNETKSNIEILDSTWFTNLVVSGSFNVEGHFRWQPYGPGLSMKKLIWINEFKKQGYTRKAKAITAKEAG